MKSIYILGLAHSGTTIIDRVLSCYPGVIGLGEVEVVHKRLQSGPLDHRICPCGQTALTCEFWSPILTRTHADSEAFVSAVVDQAIEQGYDCLVDSSKSVGISKHYERLARSARLESAQVIRVIRDPRGWVHSIMRHESVAENDIKTIRSLFYQWITAAFKMDRYVLSRGADGLFVWYDKMVLSNQQDELAAAVGLPPRSDEFDLSTSNQHAIAGNKFAFTAKRNTLAYDARWMQSALLDDIYAGLPSLRAYYHELQRLHLSRTPVTITLPRAGSARELHRKAIETGDFSEIDAFISGFSFMHEKETAPDRDPLD